LPEIEATFDQVAGKVNYLSDYITRMNGKTGKKGGLRDYSVIDGRQKAACDAMSENKTRMAEPLATTLSLIDDEARRFPAHIKALFEKMSADHGLSQAGKEEL